MNVKLFRLNGYPADLRTHGLISGIYQCIYGLGFSFIFLNKKILMILFDFNAFLVHLLDLQSEAFLLI